MRALAFILLVTGGAAPAPLSDLRPVAIPDYDAERSIQWSCSREEYAAARADEGYVMEQFSYVSAGVTVGAYLYRPRRMPPRPVPVIVYNRGGFIRPSGFAGDMLVMAHRFARAGFVVVAPHYRGSNGWTGRDEVGGADLADLMSLAPLISRLEGVDASRVFLAGESRGGAMVYMALRDGFPARAAAVWGAFTDVESLLAPGSPQAQYAPQIWPDLERRRAEIVESRSALRWADRIGAPVLILHGAADEEIPLDHSRRMAAELARLGKPHELRIFEGEQHRIGRRGTERDAATLAWFRRFGAGVQ